MSLAMADRECAITPNVEVRRVALSSAEVYQFSHVLRNVMRAIRTKFA